MNLAIWETALESGRELGNHGFYCWWDRVLIAIMPVDETGQMNAASSVYQLQ